MNSKLKNTESTDTGLIVGAYFPEDDEYKEHLQLSGDTQTVSCDSRKLFSDVDTPKRKAHARRSTSW
jgi:hypothetical protein